MGGERSTRGRRPIPASLRVPLTLLAAVVAWVFVVGRDPGGAIVLTAVVAGVLALAVAGRLLIRRRMRQRRDRMPDGTGVWMAKVEPDEIATSGVLREAGPLAWLFDVLAVDVFVDPQHIQLVPARSARAVGAFRSARLAWPEIADVVVGAPVLELGGKPHVTPLTPVTLMVVGERVDEFHRPMTEPEARDERFGAHERAQWDAENRQDARERYGEDYVFGTMPLTLYVDDADELVALTRRYRSGALPAV